MNLEELKSYLDAKSNELGFSHVGATPLSRPFSFDFYESWLQEGLHGSMDYLRKHAPIKEKPQRQWRQARSAIVFAVPYFPQPAPNENFPLREVRVSLYAKGMDYHHWFKEKLEVVCKDLKNNFPEQEFVAMTDSGPVLERDLARRAGLGWVAKNTCLIHPKKGSLFFLGEIYTSLDLQSGSLESRAPQEKEFAPLPDFCGTCTRCLDICPTNALVEPRKLDARKCISYLTIESREVPPVQLRGLMGDWFFGCDLCQTVCPWNQKIFKGQLSTALIEPVDDTAALEQELRWILTTSGKQLEKAFRGTPLARAGSFGLKRNAIVTATNRKLRGLANDIASFQAHPKLGELASWSVSIFESLDQQPS